MPAIQSFKQGKGWLGLPARKRNVLDYDLNTVGEDTSTIVTTEAPILETRPSLRTEEIEVWHHICCLWTDVRAGEVTGVIVRRLAPNATLALAPTPGQAWVAAHATPPDVLIIDPRLTSLDTFSQLNRG